MLSIPVSNVASKIQKWKPQASHKFQTPPIHSPTRSRLRLHFRSALRRAPPRNPAQVPEHHRRARAAEWSWRPNYRAQMRAWPARRRRAPIRPARPD